MASPSPGGANGNSSLSSVTAFSSASAWAVGGADQGFILHWNGTSWKLVASPGFR